jgi:hypothetical protein
MSNEKKSLLDASEAYRKELMKKNIYDKENSYNSKHTRAMSDDETPNFGKGTGEFMDTKNGGSAIDVKGNPAIPKSGREGNLKLNHYNSSNPHKKQP